MTAGKKIPMRRCTGCGEMKSKKEMIRVIRTAEGEILLDATGKKNGRGAYLCFSAECLEKAVKSRGLERSIASSFCSWLNASLLMISRSVSLFCARVCSLVILAWAEYVAAPVRTASPGVSVEVCVSSS